MDNWLPVAVPAYDVFVATPSIGTEESIDCEALDRGEALDREAVDRDPFDREVFRYTTWVAVATGTVANPYFLGRPRCFLIIGTGDTVGKIERESWMVSGP